MSEAATPEMDSPRIRGWVQFVESCDYRWIAIVLAICFLAATSFDISTYPLVGDDEAILNDPGRILATTGELRSDVLKANPGWNNVYVLQPPGLALSAAASYSAFGFGIWQTRLTGVLFGAFGIALIFVFVREVTQRTMPALLAAMALFAWPAWVLTSKSARMDSPAICFLLIASILIHRCMRSPQQLQPVHLFLAGLGVSVASTFHTASFTWALALLVPIIFYSKRRFVASTIYCLGASLIIGAWVIYGLYHFQAFENQFLFALAGRAAEGGLTNRLFQETARYLLEFRRIPTLIMAVILALAGFAVTQGWRNRSVQFLFILTAALVLSNVMLAGKVSGYYTLYPMTLILCVVAVGVAACIERDHSTSHGYLPHAAFFCFVVFFLNIVVVSYGPRVLAAAFQRTERNYAVQFRPLSTILKPGDQVWGSGVAWFAVVAASARLDIKPQAIPIRWDTHPDPTRHKYLVIEPEESPQSYDGFVKTETFGIPLPRVFGSTLANKPYVFELWKSQKIQ
ncbi:MAG: glycosyltransferase family 39 protein [Pseudolabrys sp.]